MTILGWIGLGALWLICALFIYGLTFAYFQQEFSDVAVYRDNLGFAVGLALFTGLLGPFGLLIVFLLSGFAKHGMKFV